MEDRTEKIKKLNELICILEDESSLGTKKVSSVKLAKLKLRALDPGYDIKETLRHFNTGAKEEAIATFLSYNFVKPFLIKMLHKL